jgi:hypothetical protein
VRSSNPTGGGSTSQMCSDRNKLRVAISKGSLAGASVSKELHLKPLFFFDK